MALLTYRKSRFGILACTFLTTCFIKLINHELDECDLPSVPSPNITNEILPVIPKLKRVPITSRPIKRILFWSPFFGQRELENYYIFKEGSSRFSQLSFCKYQCEFTTNRSWLNSSHAILFHGVDLKFRKRGGKIIPSGVPKRRKADHYWIFYLYESPVNLLHSLNTFNGVFNLTLTYRTDSDIYVPYRQLLEYSQKPNKYSATTSIQKKLKSKTKLVAWIVSNCKSRSSREVLARELARYLPIDIYGHCGNHQCPSKNNHSRCYQEIGKSYKFYLAFENSICRDYVTEKLFNALDVGMVPILYGGADYLRHAPKGSFINADSFNSIKALADHILMLDRNPQEYLKYFKWNEKFYVDPIDLLPRAWCTLCEKLTTGNLPRRKVIKNLQGWWFSNQDNSSACKPPKPSLALYEQRIQWKRFSRESPAFKNRLLFYF